VAYGERLRAQGSGLRAQGSGLRHGEPLCSMWLEVDGFRYPPGRGQGWVD